MALPEDRKKPLHRLLLKIDSPLRRREALRVGIALAKKRPAYLCSVWMRNRIAGVCPDSDTGVTKPAEIPSVAS